MLSIDGLLSKFGVSSASSKKQKAGDLKTAIADASKSTQNGIKASAETKQRIITIAKSLEKLNPTKSPSSSGLLNGSWELIFTTNEGSSAGKLGPFVGKVVQDIDLSSKSYTNFVRLPAIKGGLEYMGCYRA
jgi:hypothetical protein